MAETLIISAVGGLLKTLWDKFQQAKDIARVTDLEFQMLKGFIDQVKAFSEIFASNSSTDIGTNLRQELVQAETKLQLWCSKKSGFLSRSSDERYRELKVLRQHVEKALDLEKLGLLLQHYKKQEQHNKKQEQHNKKQEQTFQNLESLVEKLLKYLQPENPPKNHPEPSPGPQKTTSSKLKAPVSQVSTKIINMDQSKPRAKSAERGQPSKDRIPDSPSQLPPQGAFSRLRSISADNTKSHSREPDGKKPSTSRPAKVDSAGNQSSNKDGKTYRQLSWQYLWVSMDSEFQAEDVKKRLEGVPGVKQVICDQAIQAAAPLGAGKQNPCK